MCRPVLLGLLLLALIPRAMAQEGDSLAVTEGPFFVMMGSFVEKTAAQAHARTHGGWVLRTDLYSALTPGFFAAVRGPFDGREGAEAVLAEVLAEQPEAYVRRAGYPYLLPSLGDPAVLAAFLGTVQVRVTDGAGTEEPSACAPSAPYQTITFVAPGDASRGPVVIGSVWLVDETGEVIPVRGCR